MPKIIVYGRPGCQWCEKAVAFLKERNASFKYVNIRASEANMLEFRQWYPVASTVPQIMYYRDIDSPEHIGGYTDLLAWYPAIHSVYAGSPV